MSYHWIFFSMKMVGVKTFLSTEPRVRFYKILWFDDRGLSLMTNIFDI